MASLILLLLFTTLITWLVARYLLQRQQQAISTRYGCRPAPRVLNQRPFGLDRLEQIVRADSESRLMELFLFHFRQTGSTLEHNFLGTRAYGTIDPLNVKAILSTHAKDYGLGLRRPIAFPMFGDGIFTQDGPDWKHSRDLLRPQLHHRHYESLELFSVAVDNLIQLIETNKDAVDLQPLFFRLTLDTTTAFLLGESTESLRGANSLRERLFATAFDTAQQWVMRRLRFAVVYWLIDSRQFRQACEHVHAFVDEVTSHKISETSRKQGFLHSLARNTSDRSALRAQAVSVLAAGRDTTASLLSWTFFLLVRHPQVMEKLRTEISLTCPARSHPSRDDLDKMPYLHKVLKETLRLYPPVPVNTRTALKTTVLPTGGGPNQTEPVLIPKGSSVAFSLYSMHRRPDLYGMDAEIFRPERWDEDMPLKRNSVCLNWGYLPFHGGPRRCLGADLALTQTGYTVVRLLQHFPTMKLPAKEKVDLIGVEKQRTTLVLSIKEGCNVMVDTV